jgi:F-box protein 11
VVSEGGALVLRQALIENAGQSGVSVKEEGSATLENCEVRKTKMAGVSAHTKGHIAATGSKILSSEQSGVIVGQDGHGTIEDCEISGHAMMGVLIANHSNLVVKRSAITGNGRSAVCILDHGRGTIEDCDLRNNKEGAWNLSLEHWLGGTNNREDQPLGR